MCNSLSKYEVGALCLFRWVFVCESQIVMDLNFIEHSNSNWNFYVLLINVTSPFFFHFFFERCSEQRFRLICFIHIFVFVCFLFFCEFLRWINLWCIAKSTHNSRMPELESIIPPINWNAVGLVSGLATLTLSLHHSFYHKKVNECIDLCLSCFRSFGYFHSNGLCGGLMDF